MNDFININFLGDYDSFVNDVDNVQIIYELDHYLEDKIFLRTLTFDILGGWKTNMIKYPILQMIARDILVTLISIIVFKFSFSIGSRLVSSHHSRLHQDTLESL